MNNELYHFNHNHDPRNGQFTSSSGFSSSPSRGEARKIKKSLNRLDRERAKYLDKYNTYTHKSKKALTKGMRSENAAEAKFNYEKMKEAERATNKIISNSAKHGYTVNSKKCIRDARAGKRYASYFFGGWPGAAAYSAASAAMNGSSGLIRGTKYKVRVNN